MKNLLLLLCFAGLLSFPAVAQTPVTKVIEAAPRTEKWKGWGKFSEPEPGGGNMSPVDKFARYKVMPGEPRVFSGRVEGLTEFSTAKVGLVSLVNVWWLDDDCYEWGPVQPDGKFSITATKYPDAEKALVLRAPGHPWTMLHANFAKGEAARDAVLRAMPGKTVRIAVRRADGTAPRSIFVEPFEAYRSYDAARQPLGKMRYGRFTAEDDEVSVVLPLEPVALYVSGGRSAPCYAIVDPNEADRYEFVLLPAAVLSGTFTRAGVPVKGATISMYNENEPLSVRPTTTDAEGKWRQGGLPPGKWEIWTKGADTTITLATGQTLEVNLSTTAPAGEKVVPARTFFYTNKKIKLAEVQKAAGELIDPMEASLQDFGLEKTGPIEFHYVDFHGDPEEIFELRIGVPVKELKEVKAPYIIAQQPAFRCLSTVYTGPMSGIPGAWDALVRRAEKAGLKPGNDGREVYTKFTEPESKDNVTELQMGLE